MNKKTTIQVEKTTLERLRGLKLTRRESYDEIINRMMIDYQKIEKR